MSVASKRSPWVPEKVTSPEWTHCTKASLLSVRLTQWLGVAGFKIHGRCWIRRRLMATASCNVPAEKRETKAGQGGRYYKPNSLRWGYMASTVGSQSSYGSAEKNKSYKAATPVYASLPHQRTGPEYRRQQNHSSVGWCTRTIHSRV